MPQQTIMSVEEHHMRSLPAASSEPPSSSGSSIEIASRPRSRRRAGPGAHDGLEALAVNPPRAQHQRNSTQRCCIARLPATLALTISSCVRFRFSSTSFWSLYTLYRVAESAWGVAEKDHVAARDRSAGLHRDANERLLCHRGVVW